MEPLPREALLGVPGKKALPMLAAHPGNCVSSTTVLQSMKLGVDVNRHKEVIVKAISAVLLLLLKHFKLNHVYQVPSGPFFLFTGLRPRAAWKQSPCLGGCMTGQEDFNTWSPSHSPSSPQERGHGLKDHTFFSWL